MRIGAGRPKEVGIEDEVRRKLPIPLDKARYPSAGEPEVLQKIWKGRGGHCVYYHEHIKS